MPPSGNRLLFRNVRVFDGISPSLVAGHALIDGATIAGVSKSPVGDDPSRGTTVIDGGNRVLMPGMSDAHVHLVGNANSYVDMVSGSEAHIALNGLAEAKNMIDRGLTAVRDIHRMMQNPPSPLHPLAAACLVVRRVVERQH